MQFVLYSNLIYILFPVKCITNIWLRAKFIAIESQNMIFILELVFVGLTYHQLFQQFYYTSYFGSFCRTTLFLSHSSQFLEGLYIFYQSGNNTLKMVNWNIEKYIVMSNTRYRPASLFNPGFASLRFLEP